MTNRRLRAGQFDHVMVEQWATRLERMRHRRAVHLHHDVVDQVVLLVPVLQARQQRAAARADLLDGGALGQDAGVDDIRSDHGLEQVVWEHCAPPDEPALRAETQGAEAALATRMHRHHPRARLDHCTQRALAGRSHSLQRVGIRRVAGEQLVAAIARQAHGDVLPGQLRDVVGGNSRGVGKRFVVVKRQRFGHFHRIGRDDLLVMVRAKGLCRTACLVHFVVRRVTEADREGLHRASGVPRHQRQHGRRVHAAAQERAERNIRAKTDAHGGVELRSQGVDHVFLGAAVRNRSVRPAPVPLMGDVAGARVDDHGGPWLQAMHAFEDRLLPRHVSEGEEVEQRSGVDRRGGLEHREDRLDLGTKQPLTVALVVIQGLLADPISSEHQSLARGVPDRHREHAAHPLEAGDAFGGIQVADHLGVARRRGVPSGPSQFLAQLDVVVDLPVLRHRDRATVDRDRLVPTGHVDDAEARRADRGNAVGEQAMVIRSAMAQDSHHRRQAALFGRLTGQ